MDYCGLDVASVSSYVYLTNEKGRKLTCGAVETTKAAIEQRLKPFVRGGLSVAIEAGNHNAWDAWLGNTDAEFCDRCVRRRRTIDPT